MTERVRRSREGSSSNNNNRYSIDMLLPGLRATDEEEKKGDDEEGRKDGKEEGGRSRLENVLIMSEKRSGGGKEEINRMPSGSSNRKDGGECNDNGAYLSTPPASATPLLHNQLTGSSNGREDQQEQQQQQQPLPRRKVSGIITTTTTTTAATTTNVGPKKRSAASPLKPTTQPKHMLLSAAASATAGGTAGGVSKMSKKNMLDAFQPWVLQAYGDSAKTKTITKKKYYRIVKTLRGEEINNAENSKFRFWVKAKGFHIGLPPGHSNPKDERTSCSFSNEPDLFVPTTVKDASSEEKSVYKRVAVVEHFFDIIYTVHVETEAKNGKHAGQKRTYRAITEKYAFLPREAVTKFLLQCMECQKRGSPAGDLLPVNGKAPQEDPVSVEPSTNSTSGRGGRKQQQLSKCGRKAGGGRRRGTLDINFSLPFTTTYLRQQQLVKEEEKAEEDEEMEEEVREKGLEDYDDEDAHLSDATPMDEDHELGGKTRNGDGKGEGNGDIGTGPVEWLGYHAIGLKKEPPPPPPPPAPTTNNNIYSNGKHDFREQSSPLSLSDRSGVNNHGEVGQDETSSNGNKDDEDDDDDESEDKIDTQQHDPERLKAFNMFVRLFVDENLDRMVPISKQPKEKIQAIIDSCTRQFPEFAERARKRIRTYLKSCRRNKRSRDSNGWESSRPTPAHLTSVQAEQILAQACENESQNAKRMRMGLEPVGQPLPLPLQQQQQNDRNNSNSSSDVLENGHHHSRSGSTSTRDRSSRVSDENAGEQRNNNGRMASPAEAERNSKSSSSSTSSSCGSNSSAPIGISNVAASSSPVTDMMTQQSAPTTQSSSHPPTATGGRSVAASACENQYPSGGIQTAPKAHERSSAVDYSRALNGSSVANMSIFRPNIGQAFPRPAPFTALFPPGAAASAVTAAAATAAGLANFTPHPAASPLPIPANDTGPTDLSMKAKPLLTHKLNSSEIATVRQLITGYRESAAFLLRSADELEQLLIQQQ